MDACPADRMPQGVDSTRPPAWLLPADHPYLSELTALRPDLLMTEGITSNEVKGLNNDAIRALILQRGRNVRIHILEIGYCSDLRHGERNDEKQQQHERLIRILTGQPIASRPPKNSGDDATETADPTLATYFTPERVVYHPPITLGRTGTLPASLMDTLKQKLRVDTTAANECAAKLTRHAVHYVEKFYLHRFASMGTQPHRPQPRQPG